MLQDLKGFAQFISVERGLMLFMISVGAAFLMGETLVWSSAVFLGIIVFCLWSAADNMSLPIWNNMNTLTEKYGVKLDIIYDDPQFNVAGTYGEV